MRPATPGSLRYSALTGAAELGATPLRQSSPSFRQRLRCSALHMGARKAGWLKQFATKLFVAVDRENCPKMKTAASVRTPYRAP